MKSLYKIAFLVCVSVAVSSCKDNLNPNYQYMPNMYESVAYETYSESNAFKNGKEGQLPAEGSINRGFEVYDYPNSTAGYDADYKDRPITEGSVFHVQQFGLNAMGSYANQMSKEERWLVTAYVMKLKSEL
jgi:hypothetical protein